MPDSALASTLSVTGSRLIPLQDQRSRGVDRTGPPGPDHARRLGELHDRRALHLEAVAHAGAAVDRHLAPVAVEVRAALAGLGVALGLLGGQIGPLDRHGGDHARVHELDVLALHPVAVAPFVLLAEALLDGV